MNDNLEWLKRAKMYMDMLASGTDPISGETLPNDTALNQDRLVRCFSYVAEVLGQLIDRGGFDPSTDTSGESSLVTVKELRPLALSIEQRESVYISEKPLDVSKFTRYINNAVDKNNMKKLNGASFSTWLLQKGFIEKVGTQRKPTSQGEAIGIILQAKETLQLLYSQEAQRFLLDNLDEIIAISNGKA